MICVFCWLPLSLGGARPKAAVIDSDGSLAIAKFPHHGDEYNIELWSCVAIVLARKAGINVPPHRMTTVLDQQVLIVTRFDRHTETRIPFLSAMSMIGAGDNEPHSYLELVERLLFAPAQTGEYRQAGTRAPLKSHRAWRNGSRAPCRS